MVRSALLVRIANARSFRGRFTLPGDKSLTHRSALLGALAHGETRISNPSTADDCAATLDCLGALGVVVRREGSSFVVEGRGAEGLAPPRGPLNARNSGSTLRMLAGILAGRPFGSVLTGDASLLRRPVERVAEPLRAMGARLVSENGRPPLRVEGGPLQGIRWELPVASAQVKTAILLAGLGARGRTTVVEPGPSRDHTERLLRAAGVPVRQEGAAVSVEGGARLRPLDWTVPGDVSSAAFLLVAAVVLPDSVVRIEHVLLNPLRTAFLDVLVEMGAGISTGILESDPEPVGWIEARSSRLRGVVVPADRVPALIDEVPALAVAASCAEGRFEISGAGELRVKESDRISALSEGLSRLGAAVEERPGGLVIHGGRRLKGAHVRSHGDHRIAMALSVAALVAEGGTTLEDAECVSVSFPEFYGLLRQGVEAPG